MAGNAGPGKWSARSGAPAGWRGGGRGDGASVRWMSDNGAMSVNLKTPEEIEMMRIAGRLAAEVLDMITPFVKPGVTTEELDRICNEHIVNVQKTIPANVGYHGFRRRSARRSTT